MDHGKGLTLALLPFDILSLIVPYVEILDIARLRFVSQDFYTAFTNDELCRLALKKLVPDAPESQAPDPSRVEFDKLIARYSRWTRRKPSKIELFSAAKCTASGDPGAWGVAGNLLVYQSPCPSKDKTDRSVASSQLVIHDLRNQRPDVNVALGSLNEGFRAKESDERSKWKIWIPSMPAKGNSFICGEIARPTNILVSTVFCTPPRAKGVDTKLSSSAAESSSDSSHDIGPSQMLAVISLEEQTLGKVICYWKSDEELRYLALNSHYVAYVTSQHPMKYHIASLPSSDEATTYWKAKDVPFIVKIYAFREREISSFGADVSGKYLFVGFGYKHHCFQIIDVSNGACLRKIVLSTPVLEEYVSLRLVQPTYEFFHPIERKTRGGETLYTELVCRYEEARSQTPSTERPLTMALWKISVRFSEPSVVEDVSVETCFVGADTSNSRASPARDSASRPAEAPSIEEQSKYFSVACAHVPSRSKTHVSRGFWKDSYTNLSYLVSTLYASVPEYEPAEQDEAASNDDASTTSVTENLRWLRPVSSVQIPTISSADLATSFRARTTSESSSKSRGGQETLEIPAPTINNCPLHIGPGWMVFAKNRNIPGSTLNLFGRLIACRPDELVIVRFD